MGISAGKILNFAERARGGATALKAPRLSASQKPKAPRRSADSPRGSSMAHCMQKILCVCLSDSFSLSLALSPPPLPTPPLLSLSISLSRSLTHTKTCATCALACTHCLSFSLCHAHTCTRMSSCHIWLSRVTYEWVMSHMNESRHIWMSHVTYEWVMSRMTESYHIWMSHVTYEWVMSHMNESCHLWWWLLLLSLLEK